MLAYIIRRLLLAVPTVFGICLMTFAMFYLIRSPDNIARSSLSSKNPSHAQIEAWKVQHGYSGSTADQFTRFMHQLVLFDFGKSDSDNEPVADKIKRGMGPSLMLAIPEFILSLAVTTSFALLLAYFRGTYLDVGGTALCVAMMSISYPLYIISGQYLIGNQLRLGPIMGWDHGLAAVKFLVLPTCIGVISGLAGTARFYRTVFLEEMNQDYARTARAKGVSETGVLFRHVLKNAMIPLLTSVVMGLPFLFLGSLLMESFFGIPGLGSLTMDAINSSDFSVLRVIVFIGSLLYIAGALLTDISYTLVDPRVRLGAQ